MLSWTYILFIGKDFKMKITRKQLRRIIREEHSRIIEAAPGSFGGYDSIVEEIFQELSSHFEEAGRENKDGVIEFSRDAVISDVIWPRLEEALPGLWDELYQSMADTLYMEVAREWHMQHH